MVIVTNTDEYSSVTPDLGPCAAGKAVVRVEKK
jgi:hypothetical protein